MQAVIVAGGIGSRLRPMTDTLPKPMLPINGKPILEHQLEILKKYGITEIIICSGYLADKIEEYFGDGEKFGVSIKYSHEKEPLGTGGAIKNASEMINGPFLTIYGDIIFDMNIESLISFHKRKNALATIVVHETDHPYDSDIIKMDENSRISKFIGKPSRDEPLESRISKSSIYFTEREILDYMPEGKHSFENDVLRKLIEDGKPIFGYMSTDYIRDIGTFDRIKEVEKYLKIRKLKDIASEVRQDVVSMVASSSSGHPGGSLSCTDILVALYFYKMKYDVHNPKSPDRDYFVLSKGHAAPALYSTLARAGFFDREELKTFRKINSKLQGHPDLNKTPGLDASTGSLGQGLSVAVGIALGIKLDRKTNRVYAVLGDGECDEGQIWEAAMAAANYNLSNITAFIDRNGLQIDGPTEKVMKLEPLEEKWKSFGWNVLSIDGNSIEQIIEALERADNEIKKPTAIIANTVKGRGISFMENRADYHGKAPGKELLYPKQIRTFY